MFFKDSFTSTYVILKWWKTWRTLPVMSWVRAAALYRAGRFDRAEILYRQGLSRHSSHPAHFCARLDLAYCLFRNGKFEEAERELKYVAFHSKSSREAVLRLSRLQLWSGRPLEAAWTIRRALRDLPADVELVSTFMLAVIEHGGPKYLLNEAFESGTRLNEEERQNTKVRAMLARLTILKGGSTSLMTPQQGELESIALAPDAPFEAVLVYSELLLQNNKLPHARLELRRAMSLEPNHPRVQSLLAELYLRSGQYYNPEYALQLATSACQSSGWLSAREMHVLAESYYHAGDNVSALVMANKAKQCGSRLLGEYPHVKSLERLIGDLNNAQSLWVKSKVL